MIIHYATNHESMNRKPQIEVRNPQLRTDQSRSPNQHIKFQFDIIRIHQMNVQAFGRSGKETVRETSSVSGKLHRRKDLYTAAVGNRTAEAAAEHRQMKEKWRNQRGGRILHGNDGYRKNW